MELIPKKLYICSVKHTYMKKTTLIILFTIMTLSGFAQGDWCGFERYRADNERIIASGEFPEVVFMGNSITEYWALYHPEFFKQHNYCGRGIGGCRQCGKCLRPAHTCRSAKCGQLQAFRRTEGCGRQDGNSSAGGSEPAAPDRKRSDRIYERPGFHEAIREVHAGCFRKGGRIRKLYG